MPKLPDYPDAGNLSVADAQAHLKQVNGSSAWGTNESAYTLKALEVLPATDTYRQRFVAQAGARITAAVERVPLLENLVAGILPAVDTSKSAMTEPMARAQLVRVMNKNVDGQLEAQTIQALGVLHATDETRRAFMAVLEQRLAGEKRIRDDGPSTLANLPVAPS